jgi:cytochrome b
MEENMSANRFRLWDAPTRLFHWALALLFVAAVVTGQLGASWMEWHGRIGLLVLGLLVFRLSWGIVGSTYARFAQFFPTPARLRDYLAGRWSGDGHNPLGALSVFSLLGLMLLQAMTGLFGNDDISFRGPLYDLVSRELSNRLTGIHHLLSNLLIALTLLHVAAIGFYGHVKKQQLLKPMISGWKSGDPKRSAQGGGRLALIISLAVAALAIYGASGAWLPEPPPPAEVPSW